MSPADRCPRCTTPLRSNGTCGPCTFHSTPNRFAVRPEPEFTLAAAAQALIDSRTREQGGTS